MEPSIHNHDALWLKIVPISSVRAGDVILLGSPGEDLIIHRVVNIQPWSKDTYFLTTKGDANLLPEESEVLVGQWTFL
jgi:signal peptidase I